MTFDTPDLAENHFQKKGSSLIIKLSGNLIQILLHKQGEVGGSIFYTRNAWFLSQNEVIPPELARKPKEVQLGMRTFFKTNTFCCSRTG